MSTTYLDATGTPVRLVLKAEHQGTLTNASSGKSVIDRDSFAEHINLLDGTDAFIGVLRHITIPGLGALWLDVGRGVGDADGNVIFEAGVKDYAAGLGALCAYLGD
jgi:hypothetical protein